MATLSLKLEAGKGVPIGVIPAAGFCASLYPASKAVKPELFPIVDRDGVTKVRGGGSDCGALIFGFVCIKSEPHPPLPCCVHALASSYARVTNDSLPSLLMWRSCSALASRRS